ncbi:MAG: VWA domain-containing protein, partial [Thermogutta sp.]|nr:VWA domain-containing protein [Thermogutta sp.]
MTFGAATFLLAALAAVIPPILHMINRRRAKQLPFSTLRFLRISVQKTRRRRQLHDILLMLLRMAVLILIAVGLARPTVSKLRNFFGGAEAAVAVILDNSASMATIDEGRPRFEWAVRAAEQILDELGDGDQVALWTTSGIRYPELGTFDRGHDKVRQLLAQVGQAGAAYERGDVGMLVQEARRQLAASTAPNRQIFVITDNQAAAWQGLRQAEEKANPAQASAADSETARKEREIPIIIVDCSRTPKPNVAVRRVEIQTVIPVAGIPMKATAEVFNASSVAQQRLLELYLDGTKIGSSPELNIAPETAAAAEIVFTVPRSGLHQGEVRLAGEDGNPRDDRRYFTIEVGAGVPVALVCGERHEIAYLNDSFYLERALQPLDQEDWAIKTTVLSAADLATEPASNYRVIYMVNVPALDAAVAEKLADYVEHGGHLVWIAGPAVDVEAYNAMNAAAGGRLLPAPLSGIVSPDPSQERDSWYVASLDKQHPAVTHLVEPPSLYRSVLAYKYVRADAAGAPDAMVIGRLDGDGDPWLMERRVGEGSTLFLATNVHVDWTNLPLRPIFVPLVARLTFHLAGGEPARYAADAGGTIVLPFEGRIPPTAVEVLPPSGALSRIQVSEKTGGATEFRYDDTHQVGVYLFRLLESVRPSQTAFAVNCAAEEADPAVISREDLEKLLEGTPVIFAENPEDLSGTFALLRQGRSLSEWFLTAVLIGLIFETFVSNWFSPKEET